MGSASLPIYYIKDKKCLCIPTYYVLYEFLNRSSDSDGILYRDRLDLEEEDKLHFVAKKVNKRSKLWRFLNKDFEIIIIIIFYL